MKKEALVFIFDGYADWEPAFLCAQLNLPGTGWSVKTLGLNRAEKTSMGGFRVIPDRAVEDCPADFDLLVLCGGEAWLTGQNDAVLPVVQRAVGRGVPVGAICNAASFMAEHGFLDAIRHTGNTLAFMKRCAPHYRGEAHFEERQAVSDGGIITANGSAALEFTREVLLLVGAKPTKEIEDDYRLHKLGFYGA